MKNPKGFTLIELLISMTTFCILIGVIALNLNTAHTQATLSTTTETLLTDLSQQQIKAMVGDTEGRATMDNYGIRFITTGYTLFNGTYSAAATTNFTVTLPASQQVSTTFPSAQIIFSKGSGEIVGFSETQNTITVQELGGSSQRVIRLNRYGVVTRDH